MANGTSQRASDAINGDRLWSRLAALAEIGATSAGGVNRQALSAEDGIARTLLAQWALDRGFSVALDRIGNLFVRRAGAAPELDPILTGSHLDTRPTGGRFDGAYGVMAGFEVLEALEDARVATRRAVEVVAWTNEEGCRFQPGCMGSAVFTASLSLATALAAMDDTGTTVACALESLATPPGSERTKTTTRPVAAYVEAHIEQGPRLEAERRTIGVVSGIHGTRWFVVEVEGEAAHAGTTPMQGRKDALNAALRIVNSMSDAVAAASTAIRFTVGRFNVWPNSPNTIPGRVTFTLDLRGADDTLLECLSDRFLARCSDSARRPCRAQMRETFRSAPQPFDQDPQNLIRNSARTLKLSEMDMESGAFHDALFLARHCRTAMIFVPCADGISHNEAEDASPQDLTAGARTLADVVCALATD